MSGRAAKLAALALSGAALAALAGCGDDESSAATTGDPAVEPAFPADYTSSYTEVRDCRQSGDHDLNIIRVLAGPAALGPYRDRADPFPEGAVVLKEEYDFADTSCSGAIKQWTLMVKLTEGDSSDTLGWKWQQVDAERNLVGEDIPRCYACHSGCTPAVNGYDYTCAFP